MLEKYFNKKINTKEFKKNVADIIQKLKGKNVVICGEKSNFIRLNKIYNFSKYFNITGYVNYKENIIADCVEGIKVSKFDELSELDFDYILITSVKPDDVCSIITNELDESRQNIEILFKEDLRDTSENLNYLLKYKFNKTLPILCNKLKGKKVLFYGGGLFFHLINKYYDLSPLNAIGVVDKNQSEIRNSEELICGYKLYSPKQILELNPDYILITTKKVISIANSLYCDYVKGTQIRIIPLIKKNIISTILEG